MADDIVTRLRDKTVMDWEGDEVTDPLCDEAADEIERLRELLLYYAKARQGISLNWIIDRHGNWSTFAMVDKLLLEEARRGR